jgi:outer membrane PBP1 activator LpoA protein
VYHDCGRGYNYIACVGTKEEILSRIDSHMSKLTAAASAEQPLTSSSQGADGGVEAATGMPEEVANALTMVARLPETDLSQARKAELEDICAALRLSRKGTERTDDSLCSCDACSLSRRQKTC